MSEQQMVLPSGERGEKFLFSVIMPVYNTEKYVEETIQSVITQTIGFMQNIQLILVNNATTDNAGAICERYQRDYPYNVVYIELLENRGPSGARNAGIPYVCGKYVNFLDSDDKWSIDSFDIIYRFFEKHFSEVDLVASRMHHFGAIDDWTRFDYKFAKTKVCNILADDTFMQFNGSSVVIKAEVLEWARFDEQSKYAEDLKFVNSIILKKGAYGLLRESVFHYRRFLADANSQMQMKDRTSEWYLGVPQKCYQFLVQQSVELYGRVIPYIQYILMQEITWRIMKKEPPEMLSEAEFQQYKTFLKSLLCEVSDYVLHAWPHLWKEYKIACLKLKYGMDVISKFECRKGKLFFHELVWCNLDDPSILTIVEHHIESGVLLLDGKVNIPFPSEYYQVFVEDTYGNRYRVEEYPGDESNVRLSLGEPCLIKRCFRVAVPLLDELCISFKIQWGMTERMLPIGLGKFSKLTRRMKNACCFDGEYQLAISGQMISVVRAVPELRRNAEKAIRAELLQKKYKRVWMLRTLQPLVRRRLNGKKLWLITDRITRARDNGEFLFRFLSQHPQKDIQVYFAISKNSLDYKRMKKYGKVVAVESFSYQLLYLAADAVFSSSWGYAIEDPFGWHRDFVKDLFRYRFVYLDHALTKDDISVDVGKHMRNFAMWTTGSQAETESILRYPYGYSPDVPQTTGLARYDAIYPAIHTPHKKIILIAPTWRKSLAKNFNTNGLVEYNSLFAESEFFHFYNTLINDKRLLTCMENYGYRGVFRLHPMISTQAKDFQQNNLFVMQIETELYETEFFETAMVVTDYSSIAMDYGYIGRPVVYAQFDKEDFYRTHSYHESYFDYENDGFGPVCYDYESTVDAMIQMIEKGCIMDDIYAVRRKQFFAYIDDKNCERICRAVRGICDARNEYTGGQGNG